MTPARFRELVSGVLIIGVVTSASLIALGFIGATIVGWGGSLRGLPPTTIASTDFSHISTGLRELRPIAVAQVGLLALLATPVLRVLTSMIAFAIEGDRLYTILTLVVLTILLVSLFVLR